MTPPATAPARPKTAPAPSPEAILLEALAAAGEALTYAIVHHDLDAIVAATTDAELLMARLSEQDRARTAVARRAVAEFAGVDADVDAAIDREADSRRDRRLAPERHRPDPAVLRLGARIGATVRRNALLLERAWATDAALLRLLATAARAEMDAARGSGYALPTPDAQPAGWLDRSA
jgi:hypothetical protein